MLASTFSGHEYHGTSEGYDMAVGLESAGVGPAPGRARAQVERPCHEVANYGRVEVANPQTLRSWLTVPYRTQTMFQRKSEYQTLSARTCCHQGINY